MLQTSNRRKILLPIVVITIAVASFFIGKYSNKANDRIISNTTDTTKCGPCMAYNNSPQDESKLDLNLLKTMAFNYQKSIAVTETRSVWFSLETIKKFVYQIETKSCNTCTGNLGVRIYYGRYPVVSDWSIFSHLNGLDLSVKSKNGGINNYGNIHTIFMVPTIDKPDGYHHDFDPAGPAGCDSYNTKTYIKMSEDTAAIPAYTLSQFGSSVTALMAQNHGDACPPLPPAGSCPAIGAFFNK
jgi:hypothetical protein